jgi:cephalosporin hydroxylase
MTINQYDSFREECANNIRNQAADAELKHAARNFFLRSFSHKYPYSFEHLGRPIIQYPQDIVAVQELIWNVKPDLIIETGIAHGGSLILSASMLALIDMCEAIEAGVTMDPKVSRRKVLGIDIDIRSHNRQAIEAHPMASRIQMIQGSSIAPDIINKIRNIALDYSKIMVFLDSNHTHYHVLAELEAYAPLTSIGSYCVVFDTIVEDMPAGMFPDRPWGPGDNPKTATLQYIKSNPEFQVDYEIDRKLLVSVAPEGFLKRITLR